MLQEKRPTVSYRGAVPCVQGCQARSILPAKALGLGKSAQTPRPLCATQRRSKIRSTLNGGSSLQNSGMKCRSFMKRDAGAGRHTVASGSWGCRAFLEREWFQLRWPEATRELHITVKQIAPIVLAAAVWGREWSYIL